jgi:hypothetical protein
MKKEIFETEAKLQTAIDGFFSDTLDAYRTANERVIERNLLYYCGFQHLEYMRSSKSFRVNPQYQYIPKPVSNEIREYVRSIKAMLMNQKMVPRVWPNTNEKEDQFASDLGQNVLTWMDQSHDGQFFDEKEKCIIWLCLSGTAFMRSFPDLDGGKWFMSDDGLLKTGDVGCETVLPFNIRMDTYGDRLDLKRWVAIQTLKPREWVEDTFKVTIDKPDKDRPVIDYQRRIAGLVASVSAFNENAGGAPIISPDDEDSVLFREVEFKPQPHFPLGKYAISAGGKILRVYDRLPIKSTAEQWQYSLTDFHFNYVPGRFWSDPPVNDLISPQNIINDIDQALIINRKGIGRPVIMTPGDVGLKKMDMAGQGFLALTFNPIMGQKPDISRGTPLEPQVLEERRLQKEQMQDLGGDPKSVLRGKQPSANASGILTQELRETAEQGKLPDIDRFNRSLTRVYKKRLILAQEVFTEERLVKCVGRGNKVKIMKFKAADLRGNTDVRLELDSGLISTKSGQSQMILNMIQAGFFQEGEGAVSPSIRQEVMQRMGMTTFTDQTDADTERAEAENVAVAMGEGEVMTATTDPQTGEQVVITDDPLFKYDNHAAHEKAHRKFIISPEFKELPLQAQAKLIYHTDLHAQQIEEAKPDLREYVQIDKLIPLLRDSERAQVLADMGVKAGTEPTVGVPSADVVVKSKEKLLQTDKKSALKREEMQVGLVKHGVSEGVKASAIQSKEKQGRVQGSKPE